MTEEEINQTAFQLASLITVVKNEPILNKEKPELVGSAKEKGFFVLPHKLVGNIIERRINHADEPTTIFISEDNKKYGFNEENYILFKSLIENILSTEYFQNKVSFEFIERNTFDWVIEIHKSKVERNSVLDYLKNLHSENINEYQFYFPVLNLEIEKSFKIGNVEFT